MSPEQAMGGPIDCRADIFPMGIVLWELLTGKRLMTGESAAQTLHRLVNVPIPRVRDLVPTVDPILDEITARALEKDPVARYQSAAEMRDALEGYLARLPGSRQDEVGRRMVEIFGHVREEVQRQIQKHMAAINAAGNTQELQALTAESLKRMERSGANISGQLLHLGIGSGSGSGIVSNYPPNSEAGAASGVHAAQVGQRRANAVLVVAALLFLASALGAGFMFWKGRSNPNGGVPSASPSATLAGDPVRLPTATATSVTTALPSATVEPPTVASLVPPVPTPKTGPRVPPTPKGTTTGKVATTAATAPAAPAPAEEPGFLTLQTYPFSRVSLGGRVLGTTPLVKVSLPPGSHTLVAENADQGLKQSISVTIESGKVTTKNLELRK
jgi:serine/threonine-protein kinase